MAKSSKKIFVINPNKNTPAYTMADGVDYVPMSKGKIWLIQLLNIAGTGPIFWSYFGGIVWTCRHALDCHWLYICWGGT